MTPSAPSTQGEKRLLSESTANASHKRRAPYTLRACDACRKRKGRCDGSQPCEYCNSRSTECIYSYTTDERRGDENLVVTGTRRSTDNESKDSNSISSLSELLKSMQEQLAALSAQVQASAVARAVDSAQVAPSFDSPCDRSAPLPYLTEPGRVVAEQPVANTARRAVKRFVGPTSADYSFNVAESKVADRKQIRSNSVQSKLPSMEEDQSDEECDLSAGHVSSPGSALSHSTKSSSAGLLHFKTLLDRTEAIRLVYVYGDVIGQMHPIYHIDRLVKDVESVYDWPQTQSVASFTATPPRNDLTLLIMNMVLCIALCAESVSQSPRGKAIFNACETMINAWTVSASVCSKQVTLALLVGFYHFFMGSLPLAWRMCGIAGRQAMELGLHNRDASQHYPDDEQSHAEIVAISCSLIILDRQWSAAAGLPPNFQLTDFELATKSSVDTPYLKAMMAFTLISNKFNEPISKAAQGEPFEEDGTFDVLNFQVEQWRKRAIEKHDFVHPDRWATTTSKRPPAWTLMLYLRANAVRGILLRPFFLTEAISAASKKSIRPALEVVADTINVITILDESTDIYRKQHPLFQHFLAVSCALLFLLVTYVEQHRSSLDTELPHDFPDTVKDNYWKALRLSAAYSGSFAASRRLWKRLITMRSTLCKLGILSRENSRGGFSSPGGRVHTSVVPNGTAVETLDWVQENQNLLPMLGMDDYSTFDLYTTNTGGGDFGLDFFAVDSSTPMGEFHPLRYPPASHGM